MFVKTFVFFCVCMHCLLAEISQNGPNENKDFFSDWRSYKEINSRLRHFYEEGAKETAHISLYSIGKSAEGRPIHVLSIGKRALEVGALMKKMKPKKVFKWRESLAAPVDSEDRTDIALLGTLHGREWSAASSVMYSCWKTIEMLKSNQTFIHEKTIHFMPVMNPDGYQYTFDKSGTERNSDFASMSASNGRLWRKNRRNLCSKKMRGSKCAHGVDLNRNFGVQGLSWGFGNSKATTEVFQGKRPFSEPENKRLGDWFSVVGKKLEYVLDVHCCSSAVLQPFYYREEPKELGLDHKGKCTEIAKVMGKDYSCREREKTFSESNTGIFADWIANEVKVPHVYIVETRGNKESKKMEKIFLVPRESILEIGSEVYQALALVASSTTKAPIEPSVLVEKEDTSDVADAAEFADPSEEMERLFLELERGAASMNFVSDEDPIGEEVIEDVFPHEEEDVVRPFVAEEAAMVEEVPSQQQDFPKDELFYGFIILTGLTVILIAVAVQSSMKRDRKRYLHKII